MKKTLSSRLWLTSLTTLAAFALSGCGSGSGAAVEANPVTTTGEVSNYNGPPPATEDVQRFKLNVWDNLVPDNRCGTCHGVDQDPRFVRSDDVNLAYDAANTLVDLTDPGASEMVSKVRGGHNCWLTDDDACGDIIESYIESWSGGSLGAGSNEVALEAPVIKDPGSSKNFPLDSGLFATTVHPVLTTYCSGCHTEAAAVPQSPYFAAADADAAYEAAQAKIDLETPSNSRFVLRLGNEFHNCWSDCTANSAEMLAKSPACPTASHRPRSTLQLVTSKALNLTDGLIAASGGRHEANVIALYEFKTGSGSTVFDTSGVEPALNLTMSDDVDWVGGWGIQITDGKAQGSTTASKKLHDLITSTNEYSVEIWSAPGNVVQDGPARIVTYSGGPLNRNFMLGQTLYSYDFLNRTSESDGNGDPRLSTSDVDEDLQATLQHAVVTYDPNNGRRVYVNGLYTDDVDDTTPGLLTDWDDTYAFAVGSEVDNDNRWAGTVRFLAIHNRALTEAQILENYDAGVGEKYFLLFNVSDHVGIPDAYVYFVVSQFDSFAYLFTTPTFALLDPTLQPGTIPVSGMRIGLNGREVDVSQAYANLDTTIVDADYDAAAGRLELSRLGTVIPLEKGPTADEFFLSFEVLGNATNVVVEADPAPPGALPDFPRGSVLGIRDFAEVNATMSKVTGIPITNAAVDGVYDVVFQALPVQTGIEGFSSSQQMGVTQMAIQYCNVLVDDTSRRTAYFPGFDFSANVSTAFNDRSLVIDPLLDNMVGAGLSTQPDVVTTTTELNALIDTLVACGGSCEPDRTERVVKGACAAVLASAAMLVQ